MWGELVLGDLEPLVFSGRVDLKYGSDVSD